MSHVGLEKEILADGVSVAPQYSAFTAQVDSTVTWIYSETDEFPRPPLHAWG
jgi:hypothetical protein